MWAESQPGPSRCQESSQGYCGYCRVLYSNLDQHLSSLRHLDSVRKSSRGSSTVSSDGCRTRWTLLERFLSDVLEHHPHRYHDPRPSHADLPPVSALPLPRAELDMLHFCDNDSPSPDTREHLPSSHHASFKPANQDKEYSSRSQSGEEAFQGRLSSPVREQEGCRWQLQPEALTPSAQCQAPPSIHRKAHRKTNRRKASESSSSQTPRSGDPQSQHFLTFSRDLMSQNPTGSRPLTPTEARPWRSWQKERREAQKEEAFSSDHTDPLDRTIEEVGSTGKQEVACSNRWEAGCPNGQEVIQKCCHDISSTPHQQEEMESLHLSLPVSLQTQSEGWDSPVQVGFQVDEAPTTTPVQVTQMEQWGLSHLINVQVDLEDQVYSHQLDHALHSDLRAGGRALQDQGFWTLPIEEVLPIPQHIPQSFWGKSWTQIEQEDEEKVERLVQQFRRGTFCCYFDSESLARFGRRNRSKKIQEPDAGVLPLMERDDDDSAYKRRRKRQSFKLVSRCQVVKVSHSTQTIRLVVPAVQMGPNVMPASVPAANQSATERTPEMQTWRSLPSSYSNIVSPVQPRTSLVYLLCSPSGSSTTTPEGSAHKRCRKRRRPLELQHLKLTYKPLPVRFYEPRTNRILRNPPKGLTRLRGAASSGPPPPCVRQLFRSLSPDLNTNRKLGQVSKGDAVVLSVLSRDGQTNVGRRRRRMPHAPSPAQDGSERGNRDKTQPTPSKRRSTIQHPPLQPRREGLRRTVPSRQLLTSTNPTSLPSRRGKGRRGRGYKRTGR